MLKSQDKTHVSYNYFIEIIQIINFQLLMKKSGRNTTFFIKYFKDH